MPREQARPGLSLGDEAEARRIVHDDPAGFFFGLSGVRMATFAEQMVEKLQAILLANAGVASVSVDGTMVAYTDLEVKLAHWQGKVK